MPGKSDHQRAASENQRALRFITSRIEDFPQWVTTIAFYTAVQVVEAILAVDGRHSDDHKQRNLTLKKEPRFQHIWKHFRPLYNDSLIARYLEADGSEHPLFHQYMRPEEVDRIHLRHNLAQIIASARTLLKDESFLREAESAAK